MKNQDFVLLGNTTDYYFAGEHNYLLDLKDQNDISNVYLGSNDYFLERIIKKGSDFSVLYRFADTKIRYTENVKLNWKLYPETKIILGIKCQLAITYAYGRRWIAYFSKDYPNHIGPYKFSGLPGLILDLQDDAGDYKFVATKIEKNNKRFAYNASGYRKFSKISPIYSSGVTTSSFMIGSMITALAARPASLKPIFGYGWFDNFLEEKK